GVHRVNHRHHARELHREALARWRTRCAQFRDAWAEQDLRRQSEDSSADHEAIARILDGPHGPPLLERLLADHDADTAWCAPSNDDVRAA
ncbi:HNH endonuclease, partial [Tsukamurella tyrosinosolvens]